MRPFGFCSRSDTGEAIPTDDLTLALASRDALEERRDRLEQAEAERLDRIDARYRAVTRHDEDDVLSTLWRHSGGWWWLRRPAQGEAGAYFDEGRRDQGTSPSLRT